MKQYNGHRSWNAWNISLWINNDESLYRLARECMEECAGNAGKAARRWLRLSGETRTPDGAKYNPLSVKLAIADILD